MVSSLVSLGARVYLDIFLELLWTASGVAKLNIVVGCVKPFTDYLSNFLPLSISELRTTTLRIGISVGHERVSSNNASTR